MKPVSEDNGGVEIHDGLDSLNTIAELEAFEVLLKKTKRWEPKETGRMK